jgi:hypothetical protein
MKAAVLARIHRARKLSLHDRLSQSCDLMDYASAS